jgi:hypothetical protein
MGTLYGKTPFASNALMSCVASIPPLRGISISWHQPTTLTFGLTHQDKLEWSRTIGAHLSRTRTRYKMLYRFDTVIRRDYSAPCPYQLLLEEFL